MGLRILRERGAHGVDRDNAQRHPRQVLADELNNMFD
jgi:hypothetical protein